MILSVLICSLEERHEQLKRLVAKLEEQRTLRPDVEVLYSVDAGAVSIGCKRNALIEQAQGEYVCFVDDDDDVDDMYLTELCAACDQGPDVVGIIGEIEWNGGVRPFVHSIKYKVFSDDGRTFYRPPNHLNPIRRELVKDVLFPNKSFGEDADWAMQLVKLGRLKTEVFVSRPLYRYMPHK